MVENNCYICEDLSEKSLENRFNWNNLKKNPGITIMVIEVHISNQEPAVI